MYLFLKWSWQQGKIQAMKENKMRWFDVCLKRKTRQCIKSLKINWIEEEKLTYVSFSLTSHFLSKVICLISSLFLNKSKNGGSEYISRKQNNEKRRLYQGKECSRFWIFLADRIFIFDYAQEADSLTIFVIFCLESIKIFEYYHCNSGHCCCEMILK